MEKVKPTLELHDEIRLHEKGWIAQRVGWVLMLLFFIASCLGLFGSGPLSTQSISQGDTTIEFERFLRYDSPMTISVRASSNGKDITIEIPEAYLEQMKLSNVMPKPSKETITKAGTAYIFAATAGATIKFYFEPERTGTVNTSFTVNGAPISFSHLIYP